MQSNDPMRCGAKTRNGSPCKSYAMQNGRCRMHGGTSPSGIAHANYVEGRWSKYLPGGMREDYEEALARSDLTSLVSEIGLIDSQIADALKALDGNDSVFTVVAMRDAFEDLMEANQRKNVDGSRRAMVHLDQLTREGVETANALRQVNNLIEQRRRLVDTEQRVRERAAGVLTRDQAMLLVGYLAASVKEHVTDVDARRAIQLDINRLLTTRVGDGVS